MLDIIPWVAVGLMGAVLIIALIVGIVRATKKYTVSFVDGSDVPVKGDLSPIVAKAGKKIALPAPTAKDSKFLGWFSDEACTERAKFAVMPKGGATLYGAWKAERPQSLVPQNASIANIRFNIGFDW